MIIDAIKESRKIFQRMNSYAIYRIAETLRVLLFMTLAILIFNFYPLTAIMIVMLALLNDGAILSIAYDNVRYRNQPEAWNMRLVLGIATVLGLVGPIAAFGLFYLGDRVFHLDHPQLQTMMYLMLSVAGHLTIFQTRTRGPWLVHTPGVDPVGGGIGTQVVATLIAVYGAWLVTPLGWSMRGSFGATPCLVPGDRPGEAARLQGSRSGQSRSPKPKPSLSRSRVQNGAKLNRSPKPTQNRAAPEAKPRLSRVKPKPSRGQAEPSRTQNPRPRLKPRPRLSRCEGRGQA